MTIIQLVGISIIAVFIAVFLKKYQPEISIMICLGLGVLILYFLLSSFNDAFLFLETMSGYIDFVYISVLLKLVGIAYLCEFASGICKDAGYQSISGQIETAGKVSMLVISLPIMKSIMETISSFLNGG